MTELRTQRLLMRRWRDTDRTPFAALNADPVVMEHFPSPMSRDASDALVDRIEAGFDERGFGLWALEDLDSCQLLGFTGLSVPRFHVAWMDDRHPPVVEVGWRLARAAWGSGRASEAAAAALRFGFEQVGLREIVSFTTVTNVRSQAVMERLGMRRLAFYDHPVEGADPLPSVVYTIDSPIR